MKGLIAWAQGFALPSAARPVLRRLPRRVVPVAAGDQRHPRRLDGHPAQGAVRLLRGDGDARLDGRLLRALLAGLEGRRGVRAEAGQVGHDRAGPVGLPPLRLARAAVPSILPPPAPFKIFVLRAGVARVRPLSFVLAIAIGRGLRYFAAALLALWYGDAALPYIAEPRQGGGAVTARSCRRSRCAFVWWQRRHPAAEAASA